MCPVCHIVSLVYVFVYIQRHQVHQNKHWMLCIEVKLYRCFNERAFMKWYTLATTVDVVYVTLWMFKLVAFENYLKMFCVWYPSTHGFLYWYMSQNCILWYAIFLYISIARSILIIKMPFLRFAYKKGETNEFIDIQHHSRLSKHSLEFFLVLFSNAILIRREFSAIWEQKKNRTKLYFGEFNAFCSLTNTFTLSLICIIKHVETLEKKYHFPRNYT